MIEDYESKSYYGSTVQSPLAPLIPRSSRVTRRQHFRSIPRRRSSSLYSNMTCTATYRHAAENPRNSRPDHEEVNSVMRCRIPSRPSTKPTKLADIKSRMFKTPPTPARGRYQRSCPYYHDVSLHSSASPPHSKTCRTDLVEWDGCFGDDFR